MIKFDEKKRNICVISGSRADYGLLRWILFELQKSNVSNLQLVVTGSHLSPEFGLTYKIIEDDGFTIDRKVEMLLSADTSSSISKSVGLGIIGFSDAFDQIKPDILVILGDRFEILAATIAGMLSNISISHIHGGEITEGAFDESIRHSITKMSHFHFVATNEYRNRVIQLGEQPKNVFLVGGLGIDNINLLTLKNKKELEKV